MVVAGILAATVVAFVASSAFYALAPAAPAAGSAPPARPRPWQLLVEVLRSATTATLLAGLLAAGDRSGPAAGALLGLALWALPAVLLTGSVVWEDVPARTAARHAADWLIKLPAVGAVVGAVA